MLTPRTKLLVVIAGPTAVGKTSLAIELATKLKTHILSCDSRQFYRELKIGTATPSEMELAKAPHHFIGNLSVTDYYNAARYESEALALLKRLYQEHDVVILCGGSGLYINALCNGIDELPDPDPDLRKEIKENYLKFGVEYLQNELQKLDPIYYSRVDRLNPNRIIRALEVAMATGKPYSSLLTHRAKPRQFRIIKIGLFRERDELFERISQRTTCMVTNGLVDEVRNLLSFRHLNALNTVGYKEILNYLDGKISLEQAFTDIRTNTRRYAKRQLTWFRKDTDYQWFHPDQQDEILALIESSL